MKIELEVKNFDNFIFGLNNAIIAYKDIRNAIWLFGGICDGVNSKWEPLIGDSMDNLTDIFDKRLDELLNIYKQLEKIEKENENDKRAEISTTQR